MRLVPAEEWRPAPGYVGRYEVSNLGRVRSLDAIVRFGSTRRPVKGRVLSTRCLSNGYPSCNLFGRAVRVHRLVAEAFLGPSPMGREQVNHKDCDKKNSSAENLEWSSSLENMRHARDNGRFDAGQHHPAGEEHRQSKLSAQMVYAILSLRSEGVSVAILSRAFCMSERQIGRISNKASWQKLSGAGTCD